MEKVTRAQKIEDALRGALAPAHLEVIDESEAHRGHAGYQDGGESHFRVIIQAGSLDGLSRIARHRAIHDAISKPLLAEIHALAITVRE